MLFRKPKLSLLALRGFFVLRKYSYLLLVTLILFVGYQIFSLSAHYLKKVDVKPNDLLSFFNKTDETLLSQSGRTNFLVLGVRGEGGDSPDLTDTIILMSYDQNKKDLTQISVPRDLWVPSIRDRINTAYHYGEQASPSGGIQLAEASILEVLGQPINYTVVVNFNLFRNIIDLVGGISVNVSPGFTDTEFPIPGKENAMPISARFETITFNEGVNNFNGETALKFVRSRHANGDEGTDFARARRQQQVISAIKDKIFTTDFLLNTSNIDKLIDVVGQNLKTNIDPALYPALGRVGLDQSGKNIKNIYLSTMPDSDGVAILQNPPVKDYDNKWVLIPQDRNYKALKQYIENKLLREN